MTDTVERLVFLHRCLVGTTPTTFQALVLGDRVRLVRSGPALPSDLNGTAHRVRQRLLAALEKHFPGRVVDETALPVPVRNSATKGTAMTTKPMTTLALLKLRKPPAAANDAAIAKVDDPEGAKRELAKMFKKKGQPLRRPKP